MCSATLIVVPCYNEKENVGNLIDALFALGEQYHVCIVDDNSPDGTRFVVESHLNTCEEKARKRLHLINRPVKDGRGGAVRDGFLWGLDQFAEDGAAMFDTFVEMDCDFSHPPQDVPKGVQLLSTADLVLGSRYPDGKIEGWPWTRRLLSFLANSLIRLLLDSSIYDYTNGFRFYNRESASFLASQPQRYKGYIYLSESLSYAIRKNYVIASFPILFVNRTAGTSKTDFREVFYALTGIVSIFWRHR